MTNDQTVETSSNAKTVYKVRSDEYTLLGTMTNVADQTVETS